MPGLSESIRRRKSSISKRNLKEIGDVSSPGLEAGAKSEEAGDRKIIGFHWIPFVFNNAIMVGWLVGWLAGWLVSWLLSWLAGWLVGWLFGWLAAWI